MTVSRDRTRLSWDSNARVSKGLREEWEVRIIQRVGMKPIVRKWYRKLRELVSAKLGREDLKRKRGTNDVVSQQTRRQPRFEKSQSRSEIVGTPRRPSTRRTDMSATTLCSPCAALNYSPDLWHLLSPPRPFPFLKHSRPRFTRSHRHECSP